MTRGFVGYLDLFVTVPPPLVVSALVIAVASLAAWGITESLALAAIVTIVEIAGLVLVCIVAGDSLSGLADSWRLLLPRAIIAALLASTLLYILVATVAVLSIPMQTLSGSSAPLAMIVESRGVSPNAIGVTSLFAAVNAALVQMIMASRVLYGLASQGLAMWIFARINARTRTLVYSTALVAAVVLALALTFPLRELARFTSFIALAVFVSVNASLWRIKRRAGPQPQFQVPLAIPIAGSLLCGGMIVYQGIIWAN
ncbi:MAG: amino acid permease [Candidatus Rariloculaceae bacterium]